MRTTRFAALTVSAVFALAACGGGDDSGSAASSPSVSAETSADAHNAQDVSFAQGMIPHHQQAIEMAELADGRAASPRSRTSPPASRRRRGRRSRP